MRNILHIAISYTIDIFMLNRNNGGWTPSSIDAQLRQVLKDILSI